MTVWSPQQAEALAKAGAWLRIRYSPTFYLAGFAGTGKTTLAMHLAGQADGGVAFAAFTGKAARVMERKGCKEARTIHSLIYSVQEGADGTLHVTLRSNLDVPNCKLIVIDECSMVNEEMGKDLLSFGIPILVLGDPAQLPPVGGAGFFTSQKPDYLLTEIHRQAADSPIIRLATYIREGGSRFDPTEQDGLTIIRKPELANHSHLVVRADTVIVGRNETRAKYNLAIRERRGITSRYPVKDDVLICLRNDQEKRISNGETFVVTRPPISTIKPALSMVVVDPDADSRRIHVSVPKAFFTDDTGNPALSKDEMRGRQQFTYGYAITCHKSQGSQWSEVCVFNESAVFREDAARWLYTAVTRASNHLTLVI